MPRDEPTDPGRGLDRPESFFDLGLIDPLCRALSDAGYTQPTPIQAQAIPPLLVGRDVLGCAQTGTGKTAAFVLPVLQRLAQGKPSQRKRVVRALILTPTRELAAQIGESIRSYGKYLGSRHHVIFGGVNERPQIQALQRGVDILVATPGRLLDLLGRGLADLSNVDMFVLDEADRMLDMGFVHDVKRIISQLPTPRRNLLFSATMPPTIVKLAGSFLVDPVRVSVTPQATTADGVEQIVMFVDRGDKQRLLASLLRGEDVRRCIVFARTKRGANRLAEQLNKRGIKSAAIHGNKSQGARTRALDEFRRGSVPVLVATDLAARGIDVEEITHVVNYELPNIPESYVHRAGRTARAGRKGVAISLCDASEGEYLRDIEALIGEELEVDDNHEWHSDAAEMQAEAGTAKPSQPARTSPGGRAGSGKGRRPGGGRKPPRGRGGSGRKPGRPSRTGDHSSGDGPGSGQASRSSRPATARRGGRKSPRGSRSK